MITIIPSLETMKAVVDNNIQSSSADLRRQSFDKATELMTMGDVQVLLEGLLFERIEKKLTPEHKVIFQSGYRIDNSAKGLASTYDNNKALHFVASSESRSRKVIILTDNPQDFKSICNGTIIAVNSSQFLDKVEKAIDHYERKLFSNIDDSLNAFFFI